MNAKVEIVLEAIWKWFASIYKSIGYKHARGHDTSNYPPLFSDPPIPMGESCPSHLATSTLYLSFLCPSPLPR